MHVNKYTKYVKVELQHDLEILNLKFLENFFTNSEIPFQHIYGKITLRYMPVFMFLGNTGNAIYRLGNNL